MNKILEKTICYLFLIVVLGYALFREIYFYPHPDLIPNPDVSWLVYAATRLVSGESLYVTIMETNPPFIIWLTTPAVFVANMLNIKPILAFMGQVTILSLISLFLCTKIIKKDEFLNQKQSFIFCYISYMFFVMSTALYGQREVLLIVFALPYLFLSLQGIKFNSFSLFVILFAALGFLIKPFFVLLWVFNELYQAISKKKLTLIFAWHNWFIGIVYVLYIACIYFFTPQYFTDLIPALAETYFTFAAPWSDILPYIGVILVVIPLLVIFSFVLKSEYKKIILSSFFWFLATVSFILIQRKPWLNHFYPVIFFAVFILLFIICHLVEQFKKLGNDIGHIKFISLCLSVALFVGVNYVEFSFSKSMFIKPSKLGNKIIAEINENANGKNIYPFVHNIMPTFPATLISNAEFKGSFHHIWPQIGIIIKEQNNDVSARFLKVKKWYFDKVVEDFTNNPPEIVIVDDALNMKFIAGSEIETQNRSTIEFLSQDARFAKIWQNYEKYKELELELYDDEIEVQSEEDKAKKPERFSLYKLKK